jgi:hypothetical protein
MLIVKKDLFWVSADQSIDLLIIPTNSCLNNKKHLVMGAGVAKQCKIRFPGIDKMAGDLIIDRGADFGIYHFLILYHGSAKFGFLQTKIHWKSPSKSNLVSQSLRELAFYLQNCDERIAMPVVGAGFGGLERSFCLSMIEKALGEFGDRVVVCDIE